MKDPNMRVGEILGKYLEGYFPYFDRKHNCFYWKRDPERAIVALTPETNRRSEELLEKSHPKCTFQENRRYSEVIGRLADDAIKPQTWVRGEVLDVYRTLNDHGFLVTIEAIRDGQLLGALLGVDLNGVFIAETMFQLPHVSNISKGCFCYAIAKYFSLGYKFIDVQVHHPPLHPSAKVGERVIPIEDYCEALRHNVTSERVIDLSLYDPLFSFCEREHAVSASRPGAWLEWRELLRAILERDSRCRTVWQEVRREYSIDFVNAIDAVADPRLARAFPKFKEEWRDATGLVKIEDGITTLEIFGFQVMQSWEAPLMQEMAAAVTEPQGNILEVGFGLGICADYVQRRSPAKHVIVEANRDVAALVRARYAKEIQQGSVILIEDFWENAVAGGAIPRLTGIPAFDGVIFDTYPLSPEELRRNHFPFFLHAERLLASRGRFTYFSDEQDSMGQIHQKLLSDAFGGATVSWRSVPVHPPSNCEYWSSTSILLVVIEKNGAPTRTVPD